MTLVTKAKLCVFLPQNYFMSQTPQSDLGKEEEKSHQKENPIRQYAVYSSVVFQMLAIIALGFWGGKKLNDYWEIQNNLLTVGIGLSGLGLALYNTIKQLEKINNKS